MILNWHPSPYRNTHYHTIKEADERYMQAYRNTDTHLFNALHRCVCLKHWVGSQ